MKRLPLVLLLVSLVWLPACISANADSAESASPAADGAALLVPPPEPAVTPEINRPVERDKDSNRIDDKLEANARAINCALAAEKERAERARLQAQLDEPVRIELVFSRQITQSQIDDFLALGGKIDHIYRAVSYGCFTHSRRDDLRRISH